ncbi:MAG: RtcB family protein [Chthoniobacter sp.]|nr:RtcB family protein [Chthoniobacter sp.]
MAGALMPDAHVGYGLPIGGVLATDSAGLPLRRLCSYDSAFGGVRYCARRSLRRRRGHRVPHEAHRL